MGLVQVRSDELFTQFVTLAVDEWDLQPREYSNQELHHPVGIDAGVGVGGFHLAQRAPDHQQPVRILGHMAKTLYEDGPVDGTGVDQIRKILSLYHTDVLQPDRGRNNSSGSGMPGPKLE